MYYQNERRRIIICFFGGLAGCCVLCGGGREMLCVHTFIMNVQKVRKLHYFLVIKLNTFF